MNHEDPHHHTRRDAETLLALGLFMTVLSIAVLIGTFWAERQHAMIINAVAGLVLFAIGAGFILRGWIVKKGLE